ncbi:hypothetical protein SDC9_204749 [bioreactor metagenome]|uniref:Uncharacterized protein n=1 Tax=bioreactor metagenome TaxID=1076179 RepID=A0A645J028_9ZZZZ
MLIHQGGTALLDVLGFVPEETSALDLHLKFGQRDGSEIRCCSIFFEESSRNLIHPLVGALG